MRAAIILAVALLLACAAFGHPEDEFCTPDSGLDPALCAALAELDSSDTRVNFDDPRFEAIVDLENRAAGETLWLYIGIGVGHILPGGLDHILFVLALVLSTPLLRQLVWQISAFTVAHTATLALAASGVISPPTEIVEPLIAATIALVAIEAIVFKSPPKWRLPVIFGFGLVHGMGFAGFFGSLGLPEGQFLSGLVGFNIGVEIGQLTVAIAAFLALAALTRLTSRAATGDNRLRRAVTLVGSVAIGAIGAFWTIERLMGGVFAG